MPGYLREDPELALKGSYFDPVNKLRVSQGQALIDTDFEYGMQITKWENLGLINNRPYAFQSTNTVPFISAMSINANESTVTVTTGTTAHGLLVGTSIIVQDTFLSIANGSFVIESVPTSTTFTYSAKSRNYNAALTAIFDVNKTAIYVGTIYTSAAIGAAPTITNSGLAITVTTTVPHGLSIGNEISVVGTTASTNAPNGSFFVARIVSSNQFVYYAKNIPTGTISGGLIYVRPQAQFLHRPFDGGVIFSANSASNNQAAIRQTRRYFRYQSGKGIQISSGSSLKPNLAIESLNRSGSTVTVITKEQHNLQPGSSVTIFGCDQPAFNGEFPVVEILGYNAFSYNLTGDIPSETKASGNYYATIQSWYGCTNRIGIFDSQNGLFWEFDGQQLYVVRRSSTYQLSGRVTITNGSNVVTATESSPGSGIRAFPTSFSNQLDPGDFIVIRGQSYRVEGITNDNTMTISPSYRGATADYAQISKTIDTKIPQSEWNLDTMDGNGPSGYNLDLTKMQMFYIDYSWYGAGFIRFGLRGIDGTVQYVHKILNNNVNSEAYMRSGNLPGRYESNTFPQTTKITKTILSTDTRIYVNSTEGFQPGATTIAPNQRGLLLIRSGTVYEYVSYSSIGVDSQGPYFDGVIRARAGQPAGINFTVPIGSNLVTVGSSAGLQVGQRVISPAFSDNTYIAEISGDGTLLKLNTAALAANPTGVIIPPMSTATPNEFTLSSTAPVSVEQGLPTYSATISHWGTSVIMDGSFDVDKSLVFTFGQTVRTTVPAAVPESGGQAINLNTSGSTAAGSRTIVMASVVGLAPGMQVKGADRIATGGIAQIPAGTIITNINGNTLTLSLAVTGTINTATSLGFFGGNSRALFSIRVAPSVDNSISARFGARELINRMQLTLKSLAVTASSNANMLVTAILNGVPTTSTPWTNVVGNSNILTNSSLAQIADYSGLSTTTAAVIIGGEITGGFYVNGTTSVELNDVRDLGNSILGGGEANANTNVYPDGPDVLTILVTNLDASAVTVLGRLGWSEAQA